MDKANHSFEEVKLVYRNKTKAKDRPKISSPKEAYKILKQAWDLSQIDLVEECKILLVDTGLRLMSISSLSKGGMTGTVVDLRIVFATALKRRAHGFIIAHNHPSGTLNPSDADIKLTKKLMDGGAVLDIHVHDHLIITRDGYRSIIENDL